MRVYIHIYIYVYVYIYIYIYTYTCIHLYTDYRAYVILLDDFASIAILNVTSRDVSVSVFLRLHY